MMQHGLVCVTATTAQMGPKLSLNAADRTQTGTGTILLIARRASCASHHHRHLVAQNDATFLAPAVVKTTLRPSPG